MGSRGRKSSAELSVLTPAAPRRKSDPPPELTDAQAAVWRDCVASMRHDAINRGSRPILIEYCRHVCRARMLEGLIEALSLEKVKEHTDDYLPILDKLLAMAERESKAAIACARALRLTPHSQMHPRTAARHPLPGGYIGQEWEENQLNSHDDIRKPWE